MNKKLIVLSSPSGGGKTTIAKELIRKYPKIKFSISATTRSPRPNEIDGKDYYFMSKDEFKQRIQNNDFVEYEKIFDNYYGTLSVEISRVLNSDELLIFDIDVKGAYSIKEAFPNESLLIFLTPPSLQILKSRLHARATETDEQIKNRLSRAKMEIESAKDFDYIIVNDVLSDTFTKVDEIVGKECFG